MTTADADLGNWQQQQQQQQTQLKRNLHQSLGQGSTFLRLFHLVPVQSINRFIEQRCALLCVCVCVC